MTMLFNTAFKALLIKDISDWIDWSVMNNDWGNLTWRPNIKNTVSVDMNFLDKPIYTELKQKIVDECKEFLNNTAYVVNLYEDLTITNSWANITKPGQEHHEHLHPFSIVSGVIYLDNNPSNTNLFVESFLPEVPHFLPSKKNYVKVETLLRDAQIDPATKNNLQYYMILFLSNSHHYVSEVPNNVQERRSISFNTFWEGRVGVQDPLGSHTF